MDSILSLEYFTDFIKVTRRMVKMKYKMKCKMICVGRFILGKIKAIVLILTNLSSQNTCIILTDLANSYPQ